MPRREDEIEQVEVVEEVDWLVGEHDGRSLQISKDQYCKHFPNDPICSAVPASDTAASESVYAGENAAWLGVYTEGGIRLLDIPSLSEARIRDLEGVDPGECGYF